MSLYLFNAETLGLRPDAARKDAVVRSGRVHPERYSEWYDGPKNPP